ncbi:MAG TPA: hypothetical protein VHU81_20565, partial [Thermoanaerobaculia bacterium]|nr:hypothetical protein [Thermoanaerobaculia bacterium]
LEGNKVLVAKSGVLEERAVQIGVKNWDWTEVLSGLSAGDFVVTSLDRPEVKAGAKVTTALQAGSTSSKPANPSSP